MEWIMKRWKANAGSAFDPLPTFAHHREKMLWGSFAAVTLTYLVGWVWWTVAIIIMILSCGSEYIEYKRGATKSDCQLDAYEYQTHWCWYSNPVLGVGVFVVFALGYFYLLKKLVNDNGDPVA